MYNSRNTVQEIQKSCNNYTLRWSKVPKGFVTCKCIHIAQMTRLLLPAPPYHLPAPPYFRQIYYFILFKISHTRLYPPPLLSSSSLCLRHCCTRSHTPPRLHPIPQQLHLSLHLHLHFAYFSCTSPSTSTSISFSVAGSPSFCIYGLWKP